jgi:hypothetical protein
MDPIRSAWIRVGSAWICGEQVPRGAVTAPPWGFCSLVVEPTILHRLLDYERSQAKARASTGLTTGSA